MMNTAKTSGITSTVGFWHSHMPLRPSEKMIYSKKFAISVLALPLRTGMIFTQIVQMSGTAIGTLNISLIFSILENNGHIKQENMIVV